jgi:hypothetical protein
MSLDSSVPTFLKFQKPQTPRNKKYIEFIKKLPCCLCAFNHLSDPHHVPATGQGAMGMKTSDFRAIPLCHKHHVEAHQHGKKTFFKKYNVDAELMIEQLNKMWERIMRENER